MKKEKSKKKNTKEVKKKWKLGQKNGENLKKSKRRHASWKI